ncbi:AMP deaminase-like protein [Tanacetum coccineum]
MLTPNSTKVGWNEQMQDMEIKGAPQGIVYSGSLYWIYKVNGKWLNKWDVGLENANANANGEQLPIDAAALILSHSVLHGVQPDRDIIRKEPEQETFVRLRITPYEMPSPDEAEVYKALQVCLEMRDNYVFTESIALWEKVVISDPSTPKRNPNPFDYIPERKLT